MKTMKTVVCAVAMCGLSASAAVPSDYEEYPFVEFTMGAYVDTQLQIDGHRIQFKFEDFGYYNDQHYIGSDLNWTYVHFTSYNNRWAWGYTSGIGEDGVYSSGVHEVDYNCIDSTIYIDGSLLKGGTMALTTGGRNLLIGRRTNTANFAGRFYYLIVSDSEGNEVAHFVPVRKKSTGEVGFYDTVRDLFCGNAGKGMIWPPEADPEIVRADYEECSFAEFTMGAYVDTRLRVDHHRIQFKFEDFGYYKDRHYIGSDLNWTYVHFTSYNNRWAWGYTSGIGEDGVYSSGVHEVDYNCIDSTIYIDGSLLKVGTMALTTGGRNLLIGCRSNVANFAGRFYYLIVSDSEGNEVAHLVPARKKSTGEVGFYDTVRDLFCTNSGSGTIWSPEAEPGIVPTNYVQLSSVRFPQGAYVNTYQPIDHHRIQFKFEDFSYYKDRHYIGSDMNWTYVHFTSFNNRWAWGYTGSVVGEGGVYSSGVHEVDYNCIDSKISIDGSLLEGGIMALTTGGCDLLIGCRSKAANFAGRFYYLIVSDSEGNEVTHLVPVRRKSSGEVGFYDTVCGRFCGNVGTGSLQCGGTDLLLKASSVLDAANSRITVSALVLETDENEESALDAIVSRSDGVTTTNTIATAVVASETPYTYDVTDIEGGLAYKIVVRLSNTAGVSTNATTSAYVGEVGVEPVADADVTKDQKGSFRIFRGTSETAIANDLVVNYTFGGTAVMGRDYVEDPLTVTIPAGESEAYVFLESLCRADMPDDLTISLTLGAGGYVPDPAASTATIGIVKPDMNRDWTYDSKAWTLSDGLWTLNVNCFAGTLKIVSLQKTYYKAGPLDLTKPVTSGETITSIANRALEGCTAITDLFLPETVTSIGLYAFCECSNLERVEPFLPAQLTYLGWEAFRNCGKLKGDLVIGRDVADCTVLSRCFQATAITSARIGGGVKTVGDYCFEWCYNLTNAVLEEGVQTVGGGAFQSSALTHVRLPEKSLKTLGGNCFRTTLSGDSRCGRLVSVEPFLPKSITSMGDRVFCLSFAEKVEPSLDELVIRNDDGANIQLGGGWQFEGAPSKKVTLGPGITALSSSMLQSMKSVTELRFECPYPPYSGTPFWSWPTRQTCVYVPATEASWMTFLSDTKYVTPWKSVDSTLKDEFAANFPGSPRPFGLSTTSAMFGSQWIYKVNKPGMKLLFR